MINHPIPQAIKNVSPLSLVLLLISLFSCNQGAIYEEKYEFAGNGWYKDSVVTFNPVLEDTSKVLNLGFSMEHSNDYPYSNLWLFIEVKSPDGHMQTDTMEYFLAEPDGRWIGKGNDDSRLLYWLYKRGVKLSTPGTYSFSIRQGMRRADLFGIHSFSLWVEEAEMKQDNSN
ncbi:gliding motility lipoprotein GldH [Marinilabilia rubra]|uniref:Gliding motility lipoprotein GldH n=2 Tax=Marinilabilia rubra TaxID=2162893 RepID=A0A2U2B7Z4_9BACT|nr:gliding motility lipoprotein GldH [Marinilabilia rubra]